MDNLLTISSIQRPSTASVSSSKFGGFPSTTSAASLNRNHGGTRSSVTRSSVVSNPNGKSNRLPVLSPITQQQHPLHQQRLSQSATGSPIKVPSFTLSPTTLLQYTGLKEATDVQSADFSYNKALQWIVPLSTVAEDMTTFHSFNHLHSLKFNDTPLFNHTHTTDNNSFNNASAYRGPSAIIILSLFPNLKKLSLVCNDIRVWPSINEFSNFYHNFVTSNTLFADYSSLFTGFLNLQTLDLSYNALGTNIFTELPLSLSNNDSILHNFTAIVSTVPNLLSLNLSHNHLTYLPKCLTGLQRLETLILDSNNLSLPNDWVTLSHFPALTNLSLTRNYYTGIPENLFNVIKNPFPSLGTLSLAYNYVPASANMGIYLRLPKLVSLALYGTPCALACTDIQSRIKIADDMDINQSQLLYLRPARHLLNDLAQEYSRTGEVTSYHGNSIRNIIQQNIQSSQIPNFSASSIMLDALSNTFLHDSSIPYSPIPASKANSTNPKASSITTATELFTRPYSTKSSESKEVAENKEGLDSQGSTAADDNQSTTSSKRFVPRARAALDVAISTMTRMSRSRASTPVSVNEGMEEERKFIDITLGINDRAKISMETVASVKSLARSVTADKKNDNALISRNGIKPVARAVKFILVDPANDTIQKTESPTSLLNTNTETVKLPTDSSLDVPSIPILPSFPPSSVMQLNNTVNSTSDEIFVPKARAALRMAVNLSHPSSRQSDKHSGNDIFGNNGAEVKNDNSILMPSTRRSITSSPNFPIADEDSMVDIKDEIHPSSSTSPPVKTEESLNIPIYTGSIDLYKSEQEMDNLPSHLSNPSPLPNSSILSTTNSLSSRRYAILSQFPLPTASHDVDKASLLPSSNRILSLLTVQEQSIVDPEAALIYTQLKQDQSLDAKFARHQQKREAVREATGRGYYSEGMYSSTMVPDAIDIDPLDNVEYDDNFNGDSYLPRDYLQSSSYINEQQITAAPNVPLALAHSGLRNAMEVAFQEIDTTSPRHNSDHKNSKEKNNKSFRNYMQAKADISNDKNDPLGAFRKEYAKSLENMGLNEMADNVLHGTNNTNSYNSNDSSNVNDDAVSIGSSSVSGPRPFTSTAGSYVPNLSPRYFNSSSNDTLSTADSSSQMLSGRMFGASTVRSFLASTKYGNERAAGDNESTSLHRLSKGNCTARYRAAVSGLKQALKSDSSTYTGVYSMRTLGPTALQRARQKPKRSYLAPGTIGIEFEKSVHESTTANNNNTGFLPDSMEEFNDPYNTKPSSASKTLPLSLTQEYIQGNPVSSFMDEVSITKVNHGLNTLLTVAPTITDAMEMGSVHVDYQRPITIRPLTVHSTRSVSGSRPVSRMSHASSAPRSTNTGRPKTMNKEITLEPLPPRSAVDALRMTRLHPGGISAPFGKPGYFGVRNATQESQLSLNALSSLLTTIEDMEKKGYVPSPRSGYSDGLHR